MLGDAYDNAIQNPWLINVVYESQTNKTYEDSYTIDFSQFSDLMLEGGSPLYKIEKHLDALRQDVHHLSTGFHKLGVITQTKQEQRQEREKFVKEQRARAAKDDGENEGP